MTSVATRNRASGYIKLIEQHVIALPYKTWFNQHDMQSLIYSIRLQRAGNIFGSACVEVDLHYPQSGERKRIVLPAYVLLLPAPKPPSRAGIVVIESTYGDRLHDDSRSRRQRLENVIEHALADKGMVLIPAFSIGSTQEQLYELEGIFRRKFNADGYARGSSPPLHSEERLGVKKCGVRGKTSRENKANIEWTRLPITLDSFLASRFTQVYCDLESFWDNEALQHVEQGRNPWEFATANRRKPSGAPSQSSSSDGNRSSGHRYRRERNVPQWSNCQLPEIHASRPATQRPLRRLPSRRHPGQGLQAYGPRDSYADLGRQRYDSRAQIHTIDGYSAQKGLVDFVARIRTWSSEVRIVRERLGAEMKPDEMLIFRYKGSNWNVDLAIPR